MANKNSSGLEREVEAFREERGPDQPSLFAGEDAPANVPMPRGPGAAAVRAPMPRGPGRPPGARNLRAEEEAAAVRAMIARDPRCAATRGDPFIAASMIAAIDMLNADNVQFLAELWGCSKHEAVKLWAQVNGNIQEMHRPKLARVELLPEGAPGGAALDFGGGRRRATMDPGQVSDADYEDVTPGADEAAT